MRDQTPDERRGKLWFDCRRCDKTFHADTYNQIRHRAARHLNEEHASDLQHGHELVDIEEQGGHHVHDNDYVITRIKIYVTPFDILQPAIGGAKVGGYCDYLSPSDSDNVCPRCGQWVSRTGDVEKVEEDPDSRRNDHWICSTCVTEQDVAAKQETNHQLGEFAQ